MRRWLDAKRLRSSHPGYAMHPLLFNPLQQEDKGGRTADEWVPSRATAHRNAAPAASVNGSDARVLGLVRQLQPPRMFLHVPKQSEKRPTPKEWVAVAKKLAGEHGGTLPTALTKKWVLGLDTAIRSTPPLFAHPAKNAATAGIHLSIGFPLRKKLARNTVAPFQRSWLRSKWISSLEMALSRCANKMFPESVFVAFSQTRISICYEPRFAGRGPPFSWASYSASGIQCSGECPVAAVFAGCAKRRWGCFPYRCSRPEYPFLGESSGQRSCVLPASFSATATHFFRCRPFFALLRDVEKQFFVVDWPELSRHDRAVEPLTHGKLPPSVRKSLGDGTHSRLYALLCSSL